MLTDSTVTSVSPDDPSDLALLENVHPSTWINPNPVTRYNLVVVGAGTAGLVTAAVAAGLGAKVALIERHLMGGDCLNAGCVPSKSLIRSARAWAATSRGSEFGIHHSTDTNKNFSAVMERMRRIRARLSRIDSAQRFTDLGVDVFIGSAQFTSEDTVEVGEKKLSFSRAAICTGTRPSVPGIPDLQSINFLTNNTIFSLSEKPARLAIVGAGPIGCEMAQTFSRLGSHVTLIEEAEQILPREDCDAAAVVHHHLNLDKVDIQHSATITQIAQQLQNKVIRYNNSLGQQELLVDEILIATGRTPNVENLGLDAANVIAEKSGIVVNQNLQTSNPRIYAAGDICSPFKFTHTADAMAQIVIQNALFPHPFGFGKANVKSLLIPWCTYTDPEIAHVGLYRNEAETQGFNVETFTQPFNEVDRAILEGEEAGFARVHIKKGTDKILGATIVGNNAGNIISEISVAMNAQQGLSLIGKTIHPYPTQAEVLRKLANQLRRARFSETQKSLLTRWFSWTR
tara:strand:+ start:30242 stop:31783 length:1542 start_codon:yes stop_codon:yes gene_type:complete